MKILIIGATGPLGRELVKLALNNGHAVTALVRGAATLPKEVRVIKGDVMDKAGVEKALLGQDAAISALGVKMGVKEPIVSEGTRHIVDAMQKLHVRRFVCVSALGVAESRKDTSLLGKFGALTFMKTMFKDKAKQERLVKASSLDWTIVRPSILTNKPASGRYRVGERLRLGLVATIPRADVADFVIKQLENTTYLRRAVAVSL